MWVQGVLNDEDIRESLKTSSWERAEEILRAWERMGRKMDPDSNGTKLSFACEQFLADAKARNLGPASLQKHVAFCEQLKAYAESKGYSLLRQLNAEVLRDFRASWKDAPLSASKKLLRLRSLFRWWVDAGYTDSNPARNIQAPLVAETPTLPMEDENLEKLLAVCDDDRFRMLMLVMRHTGLRISDAVQLRPEHLDEAGTLFIRQAKTNQPVRIPIPPKLIDGLRNLKAHASGYWFWGRQYESSRVSTAAGNMRRKFNLLMRRAGLKVKGQKDGDHLHMLRDAFAVDLLSNGVSIEMVSQLLGHSSITVTQQHYSPWVRQRQDALEEAMRKVHGFRDQVGLG